MTYEYTCTNCGHNWEEDQKITADRITKCPNCQQETAKRLVSGGTGFQLTGDCWAKDSYKR